MKSYEKILETFLLQIRTLAAGFLILATVVEMSLSVYGLLHA